jgi:hypothetical protein
VSVWKNIICTSQKTEIDEGKYRIVPVIIARKTDEKGRGGMAFSAQPE